MSDRRKDILLTTCQLMETQGYHATGVNQILEESGAPKGSLYYYFPEGKEGLAVEAIERTRALIAERIRHGLATSDDAATAVRDFIHNLAQQVEAAEFRSGGPITAIALEVASTNERLNAACRDTYRTWQHAFEEKLRSSGYTAVRAERLAVLIISAIEGATILSRSQRTTVPLQQAAEEIYLLLRCEPAAAG